AVMPPRLGPLRRVIPVPVPEAEHAASGVVIDAGKGLVLTTDHAVADASMITVVLADGRERPARKVARHPRSDLALITIEPSGLTESAEWGDSDALDVGDWVLALGEPFGLSGTVSHGIVSAKGRSINASQNDDLIQTDASVHPGSSGGPLIDLKGRVV